MQLRKQVCIGQLQTCLCGMQGGQLPVRLLTQLTPAPLLKHSRHGQSWQGPGKDRTIL